MAEQRKKTVTAIIRTQNDKSGKKNLRHGMLNRGRIICFDLCLIRKKDDNPLGKSSSKKAMLLLF